MCLCKSHRFPRISYKTITVYKVLEKIVDKIMYRTPVIGTPVYLNDIIKAKDCWIKGIFKYKIEKEGVHAFKTYPEAYKRVVTRSYLIVAKVEIPPFTPYWIGKKGDIAASKMKIIQIL